MNDDDVKLIVTQKFKAADALTAEEKKRATAVLKELEVEVFEKAVREFGERSVAAAHFLFSLGVLKFQKREVGKTKIVTRPYR